MKRTASLLLGLALIGTTTGCYCMPYYGAGGGLGFPLGCPPTQPTPVLPTPTPAPATGYNMIDVTPVATQPVATPVTVLPTPIAPTPVVVESLPTFR